MNVTTTTRIMFERQIVEPGTKLELSDQQAQNLVAQGVAERAKRVVVQNDDEPKAPAKSPADSESAKTDKPLKRMNRTELEAVAEGVGMENLEQYETVATLRKAIEDAQQESS